MITQKKRQSVRTLFLNLFLMCLIISSSFSHADESADLAKQSQNPVASLISVPLQFNFNFGMGAYDRSQTVLNVQPVLPMTLSSKVNLINRLIIPVFNQPDITSESGGSLGLGNMVYTAFFTPAKAGKIIWGIGPAFNLPTRSAPELGAKAFGMGPSLVVLTMPGKWVLGFLVNQLWSIGNDDLNSFMAQYFITYNLPNGWFISSAPTITANWKAPSGKQWTIPFGIGFGKLTKIGKQPIKFQLNGFYNVEKPTAGADWSIQFQTVLLFPKG